MDLGQREQRPRAAVGLPAQRHDLATLFAGRDGLLGEPEAGVADAERTVIAEVVGVLGGEALELLACFLVAAPGQLRLVAEVVQPREVQCQRSEPELAAADLGRLPAQMLERAVEVVFEDAVARP